MIYNSFVLSQVLNFKEFTEFQFLRVDQELQNRLSLEKIVVFHESESVSETVEAVSDFEGRPSQIVFLVLRAHHREIPRFFGLVDDIPAVVEHNS